MKIEFEATGLPVVGLKVTFTLEDPVTAGLQEHVLELVATIKLMQLGIFFAFTKNVTVPVVLVVAVNVLVIPFAAFKVSEAVTVAVSGPAM
jgi:hypothetical protein